MIFNSPRSVQLSFLQGYWDRDGTKILQHKTKDNHAFTFHTASEDLTKQLICLLQMLGFFPIVSFAEGKREEFNCKKSYFIQVSEKYKDGVWKGVPLKFVSNSDKNRKIYNIGKKHSEETKNKLNEFLKYDWYFRKIKKIEKYQYNDIVYDLVVEDNHTFVAGAGNLLVHNTEWGARQMAIHLQEEFSEDRIVPVISTSKEVVDYEKNDDGSYKTDKGDLIPIKVKLKEWAIEQIKKLFYGGKIDCFYDLKLDKQFSNMVVTRKANGLDFGSKITEDHLHAAFMTFAYARWLKEGKVGEVIGEGNYFKGVLF